MRGDRIEALADASAPDPRQWPVWDGKGASGGQHGPGPCTTSAHFRIAAHEYGACPLGAGQRMRQPV
jgi:hypothetical protein